MKQLSQNISLAHSFALSFFLCFFFHFIILFHFYSHSHEQIFAGRLKILAFPKLLWEFSFSHPPTPSPPATVGKNVPDYSS